jgi:hypothetical protein
MKTIERLHEYSDYMRTERRVEEHEMFEDLLLLSRLADEAAKTAYAVSRCSEDKKPEGEALLSETLEKVKEQYEICIGYGGNKE